MNILEQREQAGQVVVDKAKHIFKLASEVDDKHFGGENIPYLSTCYDANFIVNFWVKEHLCDKWDEVNKRWLSKYTKHCSLCVEENPDHYDDYGNNSWSVEMPAELFTQGSDEAIKSFFFDNFSEEQSRRAKIKNRELYLQLFEMEKHVLAYFLASKAAFKTDLSFQEKCDILKSIGVEL